MKVERGLRTSWAPLRVYILCMDCVIISLQALMNNEKRPSKYKAQLFDCEVPGKIQVLQIPEKCREDSNERDTGPLRRTYVLSPRKLKRTSGVSCRATVSIQVPWKLWRILPLEFPADPSDWNSIFVTPEVWNQAWREEIVTLPDLMTQSIRVGDSMMSWRSVKVHKSDSDPRWWKNL